MSETVTVRDRIEDLLGEIHGLAVTRQQQETIYAVVSHSTTWDEIEEGVEADIPVLDIRTVVIDLDSESVSLSDNGIWTPQDPDSSEALTRVLGRTTNDLLGNIQPDADPLETAAIDLDPELLLARELEIEEEISEQHSDKMRRHGGIDPAREWGYGASPPPEIERVVERLEEIGEDPGDHCTRLVWGKKEPMTRKSRPIDELLGNYGIELLPQSEGLIALDIDYPEQFPEDADLPDTLEISSPHGGDEQRHIMLHCRTKDDLANELGAWAIQGVSWGDLWIGDRYLVGPGSQLSEYGCDEGEHDRGEPGGCSECEDPEGGYYEILEDRPIATVESEDILELIDQSSGYELRDRGADPDLPQEDNEEPEQLEDDLEDDADRAVTVTCDSCGSALEEDERKTVELLGETRTICRGGCDR